MAFSYATRKQADKKMDKAAVVAQRWMQQGFSSEQVAEGIRNKVGYTTDVKDGVVRFHGCYNDEYENWRDKREFRFYIMREITVDSIVTPQGFKYHYQ